MKKILLFLFSLLIGIGLFGLVVKFVGWQEIKRVFLAFSGWKGFIIFFLSLLLALVVTWKWQIILKAEEVNVSFFNLFKFYLAGSSLTYFFPIIFWGGETFRAYLLKQKNSISWAKGMASVIIDRILDWTTNLAVIFLGITFFLLKISLPTKEITIIFSGIFLFLLFCISFFYFKVFRRESLAMFFLNLFGYKSKNNEPLEVEKELFQFFKFKTIAAWEGVGIAFLEEVFNLARIWFLIIFLGKNISFFPALAIDGFAYLSTMSPIPAALGIQDVIQAFAFNTLKLGANFGTAFSLILRGADASLALIGLGIILSLGVKSFGENLLKNGN